MNNANSTVSKKNKCDVVLLKYTNTTHIQQLNPVHIPNLKYINDIKRLVELNKK